MPQSSSNPAIAIDADGSPAAMPRPKGLLFGRGEVRLINGHSRARVIPNDDTIPEAVDVVVVGGGMVGTTAALILAERGHSVALCEKGVIAGEASGRAQGFIYSHFADPAKAAMLARTKAIWKGLSQRIGREVGYRCNGIAAPLDDEASQARAESWLEAMRDAPEFEGRMLSSEEAMARMPDIAPARATLLTPTDGAAEPTLAAPAIAEAAREKGASILQNCAVRGFETKAGAISGVVTERGTIRCQSVILATGAWTPRFTRGLGIRYGQADIYMSLAAFTSNHVFNGNISLETYGFRRRFDGSYSFGAMRFAVPITPGTFANLRALWPTMLAFGDRSHPALSPGEFWRDLRTPRHLALDKPSAFEERRILAPAYFGRPNDDAMQLMRKRYSCFSDARVTERWAGILSTTFDNMPVISNVRQIPGLFVGSGFSNGFTFGPAAGEALADLATGRTPSFDLKDYRLDRFSDGSKLRFYG